jgi:hypothetical protein
MTKHNYKSNFDFTGDSRMHQLTLARNSVVVVKQGQEISNGWLWGESQGRRGWFPVWVIDYRVEKIHRGGATIAAEVCQQQRTKTKTSSEFQKRNEMKTENDHGVSGFDTSANEIMGGRDSNQDLANSREEYNRFREADSGDKPRPLKEPNMKGLFSRFRNSKIIPFVQEQAKTPEWTPEPQIIYEGKVIHDFSQAKKKGFFQR